jgi:hypothetical protein
MVQIFEFEQKWIIVWGLRLEGGPTLPSANLTTCFQKGEAERTIFGRCWTGVKWAKQPLLAKGFKSRADAQAYLARNRDVIESATV